MKKFKNLRIYEMQVFCDGNEVDFKNVPTKGRDIVVKVSFEYGNRVISDSPYVSDAVGHSVCNDGDVFDFGKGLAIAKARAIENMVLQVNKVVKRMVMGVVDVLDSIEEEHKGCMRVLDECNRRLSDSGVKSKVYVCGGDIWLGKE